MDIFWFNTITANYVYNSSDLFLAIAKYLVYTPNVLQLEKFHKLQSSAIGVV